MRDVRQASLPAPGRNPEPRRPRWRAIVLLALTSTGCALVSLDLDALRTGVAAPADGGGDAAGTDAQGTGPEDAGADADAAAEPGFCSYQDQAQTFCDDFDRERQLWTRQVETGAGGRLAIDLVEPSSPPSSLLAAQDADDPGGPPFARYREKEFSTRSRSRSATSPSPSG